MQPARLPPSVRRVANHPFWKSFHYAFAGILYATRTQRNMRVHLAAGALVLFATLFLRLERSYVAILVIVIVVVLAAELFNTAIEAVVDLMTVAHHPLAKIAKDAAAGAVLVVSIGALIVGYLVFYEGVQEAGARVRFAVGAVPVNEAVVTLAIVGIASIFAKALAGRRGSALQGGAVSGHAALAFAGATLIGLFGAKPLPTLLGFFVAFLVAQSRVEGGIHSAREVAFGGAIGVCLSFVIFALIHA